MEMEMHWKLSKMQYNKMFWNYYYFTWFTYSISEISKDKHFNIQLACLNKWNIYQKCSIYIISACQTLSYLPIKELLADACSPPLPFSNHNINVLPFIITSIKIRRHLHTLYSTLTHLSTLNIHMTHFELICTLANKCESS